MSLAPAIIGVCLWSVWGWLGWGWTDVTGWAELGAGVLCLCSLLKVNVECTEFIVLFFDTHPHAMMR